MLAVGTVLQNRYRIVSHLGGGGFGDVYRAWHLSLNAPVAIKEMVPQPGLDAATLAKLRAQFQQEAAVLAHLDHPHLVRVTDYFEESGNAYLVMNLVEGETLDGLIARQGALPEPQVLAWADQLLDALAYCHSRGVIHRDVKPQNVIVRPDGRAVLVDFGLVKLWDPDDPHTRTAIRGMGTPEYAPPEQWGTQPGHTDPRSDVYSVGATLYHTLTGQAPMTANDRMAALAPFSEVRELNPQVSPQTEAAVDRAMALRVPDRFQDAAEMRAALGIGASPAAPVRTPPAPWRRATKVVPGAPTAARRVPAWAWAVGGAGGVIMLILCVAGALGAFGGGPAAALPTVSVAMSTKTSLPPAATPTPTMLPPTVTPTPLSPTATPAPTPPPVSLSLGDTRVRPADGMVMVYVPAGEFEMGSTAGQAGEQPVHTVALDGFWIDQYEVTNGQYQQCVAAGSCNLPEESSSDTRESYYGDSAYDDYPVIRVSWYQAEDYCKWAGGRLPTEAEWEYAARGPEGYTYPWGDSFDGARLNYCDANCEFDWKDSAYDDRYFDTAPVGSYPAGASWCGAQDLAGNVWEWTADWYGPYPSGRQVNPTGPSSGDYRVLRGGSWYIFQDFARCAYRVRLDPDVSDHSIGFRCVSPVGSGS